MSRIALPFFVFFAKKLEWNDKKCFLGFLICCLRHMSSGLCWNKIPSERKVPRGDGRLGVSDQGDGESRHASRVQPKLVGWKQTFIAVCSVKNRIDIMSCAQDCESLLLNFNRDLKDIVKMRPSSSKGFVVFRFNPPQNWMIFFYKTWEWNRVPKRLKEINEMAFLPWPSRLSRTLYSPYGGISTIKKYRYTVWWDDR